MFDQTSSESKSPLAIAVTVCVVGVLLSLGLCGLGAVVPGHRDDVSSIGFFLFFLSCACLILTGIIAVIIGLANLFSSKDS